MFEQDHDLLCPVKAALPPLSPAPSGAWHLSSL